MDFIVQKATELGAAEIAPLLSERTVSKVEDGESAAAKQTKWQATVVEAAKQCGQNWLPTVARAADAEGILRRTRGKKGDST